MPTKCQDCGEFSYSIYFTREWKKLCPKCYKKVRDENEKKKNTINMDERIDDLTPRDRGSWL